MKNLLLGAWVFAVAAPAVAAPTVKVGVVDFTQLFTVTENAKQDRAELDRLMAAKQAEVDAQKTRLAAARAELASAKLDPPVRARREAELDSQAAALRKMFDDAQALVQHRERELTHRVLDEAKVVMPELAKQKGVELVLGAAEALLWAAPAIVQVDLTAELAHALDQRRAHPRAPE
jgi:Skp family chaperone for outer membrane proteins